MLPKFLEAMYIYEVGKEADLYMNEDADFHVEVLGNTWELKYTNYPDEGEGITSIYPMPKTIEEAIEQLYNCNYTGLKDEGTLKQVMQTIQQDFPALSAYPF